MKPFLSLFGHPFAGMSRILDEARLLPSLLLAFATGIVFFSSAMLPSTSLAFTSVATLALAFVPASVLAVNMLASLGGAGLILRRDYLPVLVCCAMAFAAAFLPLGLFLFALRFADIMSPVPPLLLVVPALLYFLFLSSAALRTTMGVEMWQAVLGSLLAAGASVLGYVLVRLSGGILYYLASPFFLFFAYRFFQADFELIGSGFRSRQSFRRHLEAASINPHDADAHYQLGLIYLERRQLTEAASRFRKAIEIDKEEAEARYHLACILHQQGNLPEALALLQRAAALNDKLAASDVWRETGAVLLRMGRHAEAAEALEKFTTHRSYDPEGLYWYGKTLLALERNRQARELFERAIDAVNTMPYHRMGPLRRWSSLAASELKKLR